MDWGFSLSVAVTGMLVVFLSLIILIVAVYIMGAIFSAAGNAKKNKVSGNQAASQPTAEPAKTVSAASVNTVNEAVDGVPGDVVAAITAAVACVLSSEGNTKPFTVKSIQPVRGARNPWNMAGIAENTRPF
jgi:sodium pump decarboxylase gamma subunit